MKYISLLFVFCFCAILQAQDLQEIRYNSIFNGSSSTKLLLFNKTQSLFFDSISTPHDSLKTLSPSNAAEKGGRHISVAAGGISLIQINRQKGSIKTLFNLFGKRSIIKGKIPKIDWTITRDTKTVLGYTCHKATATYKCRKYTAWFTKEIPYPFGPREFYGLPGVILQVEEAHGFLRITATQVRNNGNPSVFDGELKRFKKVTHTISTKEFNEHLLKLKKNLSTSIDTIIDGNEMHITTSSKFLNNCK